MQYIEIASACGSLGRQWRRSSLMSCSELGSMPRRLTENYMQPAKLDNAHGVDDNESKAGTPVRKRVDFEELGDWSERESGPLESLLTCIVFVAVLLLLRYFHVHIDLF